MQEIQSDDLSKLLLSKYKGSMALWHFCSVSFCFSPLQPGSCRESEYCAMSGKPCFSSAIKKHLCTIICYCFYFCLLMCKQMVFDTDSCLMLELKGNIVAQQQGGEGRTAIHLDRYAWSSTLYCTLICATPDFGGNKSSESYYRKQKLHKEISLKAHIAKKEN